MTAVLVFGELPNTAHVSPTSTERVTLGEGEGATVPADAVDLVRDRLAAAGHVLALYPAWHPQAGLRTLRLIRVSLETERVALVPCSLPPLAFSLVADQLGYLAPYCSPGALTALVSALTRVTLSGAWVRSVAGLEHVPASMSDHVASYVPGGGFMVTTSPDQRIHRVTKSAPLDELAYRPSEPVHVLTTGTEDADTEWLQEQLLPELRPAHVRPFQPQPLGETFWGTKKYLEFVAFSAHPKALAVIANSIRCRPCPWCGEPVATSTCPLCSMVSASGPSTRQSPSTSQQHAAEAAAQQPHGQAQVPQPHDGGSAGRRRAPGPPDQSASNGTLALRHAPDAPPDRHSSRHDDTPAQTAHPEDTRPAGTPETSSQHELQEPSPTVISRARNGAL